MAGVRHPKEVRKKVLKMGFGGKTYAQIRAVYPIPKSTLSFWFKNAGRKIDRSKQLEHLKRARVIAVEKIKGNRNARIQEASEKARLALEQINCDDIPLRKSLLAMLYWAEGAKTTTDLKFANTDPVLSKLYLSLIRSCYSIDETRIRVSIYIHHYHKPAKARTFWSELLSVPESQFWKMYVKKRSVRKRFRKNFQGICFIYYPSAAIQRELLALGRLIAQNVNTI